MAVIEEEKHGDIEAAAPNASLLRPLAIDWDLFAEFLEGSDAPEDEKKELVEIVFAIMVSFVDLGFGIESSQRAMQAGQRNPATAATPFSDAAAQSVCMDINKSKCTDQENRKHKHKGDKE